MLIYIVFHTFSTGTTKILRDMTQQILTDLTEHVTCIFGSFSYRLEISNVSVQLHYKLILNYFKFY